MTAIINENVVLGPLKSRTIEEGFLQRYNEDYRDVVVNDNPVRKGDVVLVKDSYESCWQQYYFYKYSDGELYAYLNNEDEYESFRYAMFSE